MGTTAVESMNAAGDIFFGMSEAPLMIKPYLPLLTTSELFAVMTSGFATIAGSLFAAYASFGACPIHLLSHSIMAAPASLAVAKLNYPEVERSKTRKLSDLSLIAVVGEHDRERNIIQALSNGAANSIFAISCIIANLICILALLRFFDNVLAWLTSLVDFHEVTSFEDLLGYAFLPLAYMMGCEGSVDDVLVVSRLMGIKTFLNEFVAFQKMSEAIKAGQLSPRNQVLATYALCGFSNLGSIGIQLGFLGSLCPERRGDLASFALRSLVVGSVACFMTACVAGILLDANEACGHSLLYHGSGSNCTSFG